MSIVKINKDYQKIFELAFKEADKEFKFSNKCKIEECKERYYLVYTNRFICVRTEIDCTEEIKKGVANGICLFEIDIYKKGELVISPLASDYVRYEQLLNSEWVFKDRDIKNITNLNFILGRVCELCINPFVVQLFSSKNTELSPTLNNVSMSKEGLVKFSVGTLDKESFIMIMGIEIDKTSFQLLLSIQK